MCTLIGTSTNLVVDGLVTEAGFPGFSMFEIGKVGIFIAFFGLLYLILFSDRLLPEAREPINLADAGNFKGKDLQRIEVVLSARFPAIGRSVFDFDFKKKYGAFPIEISRGGKTILMRDMRKLNYREGDTVVLMADRNFMENWGDSSFFLMVSGEQETEPKMARWKRWTALGLLITMIIGATLGEMNKGQDLPAKEVYEIYLLGYSHYYSRGLCHQQGDAQLRTCRRHRAVCHRADRSVWAFNLAGRDFYHHRLVYRIDD